MLTLEKLLHKPQMASAYGGTSGATQGNIRSKTKDKKDKKDNNNETRGGANENETQMTIGDVTEYRDPEGNVRHRVREVGAPTGRNPINFGENTDVARAFNDAATRGNSVGDEFDYDNTFLPYQQYLDDSAQSTSDHFDYNNSIAVANEIQRRKETAREGAKNANAYRGKFAKETYADKRPKTFAVKPVQGDDLTPMQETERTYYTLGEIDSAIAERQLGHNVEALGYDGYTLTDDGPFDYPKKTTPMRIDLVSRDRPTQNNDYQAGEFGTTPKTLTDSWMASAVEQNRRNKEQGNQEFLGDINDAISNRMGLNFANPGVYDYSLPETVEGNIQEGEDVGDGVIGGLSLLVGGVNVVGGVQNIDKSVKLAKIAKNNAAKPRPERLGVGNPRQEALRQKNLKEEVRKADEKIGETVLETGKPITAADSGLPLVTAGKKLNDLEFTPIGQKTDVNPAPVKAKPDVDVDVDANVKRRVEADVDTPGVKRRVDADGETTTTRRQEVAPGRTTFTLPAPLPTVPEETPVEASDPYKFQESQVLGQYALLDDGSFNYGGDGTKVASVETPTPTPAATPKSKSICFTRRHRQSENRKQNRLCNEQWKNRQSGECSECIGGTRTSGGGNANTSGNRKTSNHWQRFTFTKGSSVQTSRKHYEVWTRTNW